MPGQKTSLRRGYKCADSLEGSRSGGRETLRLFGLKSSTKSSADSCKLLKAKTRTTAGVLHSGLVLIGSFRRTVLAPDGGSAVAPLPAVDDRDPVRVVEPVDGFDGYLLSAVSGFSYRDGGAETVAEIRWVALEQPMGRTESVEERREQKLIFFPRSRIR